MQEQMASIREREASVRKREASVQKKASVWKREASVQKQKASVQKIGISATTPRISAKRIGHQCEKDNKHLREKERHQVVIHGRALARLAGVLGAKKRRKKNTKIAKTQNCFRGMRNCCQV